MPKSINGHKINRAIKDLRKMEDKTGLNTFDDHIKDVISKFKDRCDKENFDYHQYEFQPIIEKIKNPNFAGEIELMCTKPSKEIEPNDKIRWIQLKTSALDGKTSQFVFLKGEKHKILEALNSETFVQDVQKAVDGTIFHLEK